MISKVWALLLLKEMTREGWIKPTENYPRFKEQLERVPGEHLPADRRYNPLAMNPYVLFKALPQAALETHSVDLQVPLHKIAQTLLKLCCGNHKA